MIIRICGVTGKPCDECQFWQKCKKAQVAQSVERPVEGRRVGGSTPSPGTTSSSIGRVVVSLIQHNRRPTQIPTGIEMTNHAPKMKSTHHIMIA